jgi:hypothetical protein
VEKFPKMNGAPTPWLKGCGKIESLNHSSSRFRRENSSPWWGIFVSRIGLKGINHKGHEGTLKTPLNKTSTSEPVVDCFND